MPQHYRDIPIPPRINRLPHTRSGMPVPWTTPWTSGEERIIHHPSTGPTITCDCTLGEGSPRFGEQCPLRQRRAMLERPCGVCGTPIKPTSTCVFTDCNPEAHVAEPPTHPRCLAFAMRACPRLVDLHDRAFVFICREYDLGERRAVKVQETPSDEPQPVSVWFPLGDPQAHLGVLDFYMAVPRPLQLVPAPEWLTRRAPALR